MKLLKRKHLVHKIDLEADGIRVATVSLLNIPVRGDIVYATVDVHMTPIATAVMGHRPASRVATYRVEGREVATQQNSEVWTLQVKELDDE